MEILVSAKTTVTKCLVESTFLIAPLFWLYQNISHTAAMLRPTLPINRMILYKNYIKKIISVKSSDSTP